MKHLTYIVGGWILFIIFRFLLTLLTVVQPYLARISNMDIKALLANLPHYLFYKSIAGQYYWPKFIFIIFIFWLAGLAASFSLNKFIE